MSLADGRAEVEIAALDSTVSLLGTVELEQEDLPFHVRGRIVDTQLQPLLILLSRDRLGYRGDLRASLQLDGHLAHPESMAADVRLLALRVVTPEGELALAQPGSAVLRGGVVTMDSLYFAGSAGHMRVGGSVARDGPLDLHYQLDDLRLGFLEPFLSTEAMGLRGGLPGRIDLLGTSTDPQLHGRVDVEDM
ncbi:MAG: hypothetical protein O2782_02090 [bacterium]|nr:hypothetical protein [bacterium]